jgi:hypothetical protein
MDPTLLGAMSGVLGSLVGGSASVATAWVTQRTLSKRELTRADIRKREALYGEFINECSRLLMDALTHQLESPEKLLPAYALLNRIRLCAPGAVLAEAELVIRRIADQYFSPNISTEEIRALARDQGADPLKSFGEACRAELESLHARI